MVKEWDKTKLDGGGCQKSMRKKKAKDSGTHGVTLCTERTCSGSKEWQANIESSTFSFGLIALLDELATLTVNETETDMATRTGDAATDEPARWRPKVTLRRYT